MKIFRFAFLAILSLTQTVEVKIPQGKSFQNSSSYSGFIESKKINWCDLNCESGEHIGCTHGGNCHTPADPCKFVKLNPGKMLETHNNLRNEFATGKNPIAPNVQAANMMALSWDNDLAFLAQCNLITCPPSMKHDPCHRTETVDTAGQNLAWSMGLKDCVAYSYAAVQSWYDEYKQVTEAQINETVQSFHSLPGAGHFTQLIWAESKLLGCAMTIKGDNENTECMLACNYGPAGNFLERSMYIQGPPASQCPDGLKANSKFSGLCGEVEIPSSSSARKNFKINSALCVFLLLHIMYV